MRDLLLRAATGGGGGGGVATDPEFANVVSLLPMESDLVDVKLGAVWAASGTGGITFVTKDGKLCARPAANANYINIPVAGDRANFALADDAPFTIELEVWMDPTAGSSVPTLFGIGAGTGGGINIWTGGSYNLLTVDTGAADIPGHAGALTTGAWIKVSVSYDGTTLHTHVNGVNTRNTATSAFAFGPPSTTYVGIGWFGSGIYAPSNMWFRQFRFTSGVDRYGSANYTPEENFPEA